MRVVQCEVEVCFRPRSCREESRELSVHRCSALMGFSSNGAAALIIICKGRLGSDWGFLFGILVVLGICALVCAFAIYWDDIKKIGAHVSASAQIGGLQMLENNHTAIVPSKPALAEPLSPRPCMARLTMPLSGALV